MRLMKKNFKIDGLTFAALLYSRAKETPLSTPRYFRLSHTVHGPKSEVRTAIARARRVRSSISPRTAWTSFVDFVSLALVACRMGASLSRLSPVGSLSTLDEPVSSRCLSFCLIVAFSSGFWRGVIWFSVVFFVVFVWVCYRFKYLVCEPLNVGVLGRKLYKS